MKTMGCVLGMLAVASMAHGAYLEWNPGGEGIVAATASSYFTSGSIGALLPEYTVNGAGMHEDDTHMNSWAAIHWMCNNGNSQSAWIQYEFDKAYELGDLYVWNYNHAFASGNELDRGMRTVRITYSADGIEFTELGVFELAMATGEYRYAHNTVVDFAGASAQYVNLAVVVGDDPENPVHNWGDPTYTALSEVRFNLVPEPATLALLGGGVLAVIRRKRRVN